MPDPQKSRRCGFCCGEQLALRCCLQQPSQQRCWGSPSAPFVGTRLAELHRDNPLGFLYSSDSKPLLPPALCQSLLMRRGRASRGIWQALAPAPSCPEQPTSCAASQNHTSSLLNTAPRLYCYTESTGLKSVIVFIPGSTSTLVIGGRMTAACSSAPHHHQLATPQRGCNENFFFFFFH